MRTTMQTLIQKTRVFLATFLLLAAQMLAPVSAFIPTASAAGQITFGAQFENQIDPNGSVSDDDNWGTGQLDEYSEGDFVDFRFQLNATEATSAGVMQIEYDLGACSFFTNYFDVLSVSPSIATVTEGVQTLVNPNGANNDYYKQNLNVAFSAAGTVTVIVTLQLSNTAGDCTGSNVAARLAVPDTGSGDFGNVGAKSLPMSADSVLENPSLTISKTVATGAALPDDFYFTISPAITGIINGVPVTNEDEIHIPEGQTSVTITEVNPDGVFTITEHGPAGYVFTGGTGTSCTVNNSTIGTAGGVMTATVTADNDRPVNAICNFSNQVQSGSITVIKNAIPNSLADFAFAATGTGVSNFTLDDDGDVTGADNTYSNTKTFTNLLPGSYSFTESSVSDWYLDGIECPNITEVKNLETRSVSLELAPGQNITCTFTNRQHGRIIVTKQTLPDEADNATDFTIEAFPGAGVVGTNQQTISDDQSVTFTVKHGQDYYVNEQLPLPTGWVMTENTCSNLDIDGNTPLVNGVPTLTCTITNTKLARIKIVKDTRPNDAQDFVFTASGTGVEGFTLDDDADGSRSNEKQFENLHSGAFTFTEGSVAGWFLDDITCSGTTDFVKNIETRQLTVNLAYGNDITCTFTNDLGGTISGIKYNDRNGDGDQDEGEEELAGWIIQLKQGASIQDTDTTDQNGAYSFTGLDDGTYTLCESMVGKDGWVQTDPNPAVNNGCQDVTLSDFGDSETVDFGNYQLGQVTGYKFNDTNFDGTWDQPDEPGLGEWEIKLYEACEVIESVESLFSLAVVNPCIDGWKLKSTTMTSSDAGTLGSYSFTGLLPGEYKVCETQQPGWMRTFPTSSDCAEPFMVTSGTSASRVFGNTQTARLTIVKDAYPDSDTQVFTFNPDWSENDFSLMDGEDTVYESSKTFSNLTTGEYSVAENEAEGWFLTEVYCEDDFSGFSVDGHTLTVDLEAGDDVTCTFVNHEAGDVMVTKFDDVNNNGYWDEETEPTLQGWDMTLELGTCEVDSFVYEETECEDDYSYDKTQTTGEDGTTAFTGVKPDTDHILSETQENGWEWTNTYCDYGRENGVGYPVPDNYYELSLTAGQTLECYVGNFENGEVEGFKFNDANNNAIYDNGEEKLSGWEIKLYNVCETVELPSVFLNLNREYQEVPECEEVQIGDPAVTDEEGNYSFNNLKTGTYKVCEVQQAGWTQTYPTDNEGCHSFTVEESGQIVTANFGNKAKISGRVLADTGTPISQGTWIGLAILSSLIGLTWFSRRRSEA